MPPFSSMKWAWCTRNASKNFPKTWTSWVMSRNSLKAKWWYTKWKDTKLRWLWVNRAPNLTFFFKEPNNLSKLAMMKKKSMSYLHLAKCIVHRSMFIFLLVIIEKRLFSRRYRNTSFRIAEQMTMMSSSSIFLIFFFSFLKPACQSLLDRSSFKKWRFS